MNTISFYRFLVRHPFVVLALLAIHNIICMIYIAFLVYQSAKNVFSVNAYPAFKSPICIIINTTRLANAFLDIIFSMMLHISTAAIHAMLHVLLAKAQLQTAPHVKIRATFIKEAAFNALKTAHIALITHPAITAT